MKGNGKMAYTLDSMGYTVEQLEAVGGKRWTTEMMDRMYFNKLPERLGLTYLSYNTGNVFSAKLDGEQISNSQARRILARLAGGKIWYDLNSGEFGSIGLDSGDVEKIIESIRCTIEGLYTIEGQ